MSQRSRTTEDLFKSTLRYYDLESRESSAIVALPSGILQLSIIIGKSAESWHVIAKNSSDSSESLLTLQLQTQACFAPPEPRKS